MKFFQIIKVKVVVQNRPQEEELADSAITVKKIGGKASFGKDILPPSTKKYLDACTIQVIALHRDWPANGKVIKYSNTGGISKCSTLNATYSHDGSYIPNVDYIALVLAWKNESGYFTVRKTTYSNLLQLCNKSCSFMLLFMSFCVILCCYISHYILFMPCYLLMLCFYHFLNSIFSHDMFSYVLLFYYCISILSII